MPPEGGQNGSVTIMRRIGRLMFCMTLCMALVATTAGIFTCSMAETGAATATTAKTTASKAVYMSGRLIGASNEDGSIEFVPQGDAKLDWLALSSYLSYDDDPVTVVIPSGSVIHLAAVLRVRSNKTIIATGATIIQDNAKRQTIVNDCDGTGYDNVTNVKIKGGTWKNAHASDIRSVILFSLGNNISIDGVTVYTNYQGHGISFVACKDASLTNSKIISRVDSTKKRHTIEEAVQLDIATPSSAPTIKEYAKGQCCKNITVKNCTITGGRGLCTNWNRSKASYKKQYHVGITVTGCHITGISGEPLCLHNAVKVKVTNCNLTIKKSKYMDMSDYYSNGLSMVLAGKNSISDNYTNYIMNNKIKGGNHAFFLWSDSGSSYGKVVIKNNKMYAKSKSVAIFAKRYCKPSISGNKTYKW